MKVYIYPTYTPSRDKSGNLYIKYFHDAFEQDSDWNVYNKGWKIGICSILCNLTSDVFIIHWVDLIPSKRFGKIQFILFLGCILLLKLLKKRILWVLHNKQAHKGKSYWVNFGMKFMAMFSNEVITHSQEGVSFFNKMYSKYKGKCYYIPHPVYTTEIFNSEEIKWDYIIWGTITRRKRVLEFLRYANSDIFFIDKKILICGKCQDSEYDKLIRKECKDNITYINDFLSDETLRKYICQSKIILFTYNTESVLSSGALIYSLNFNKMIIGPKAGSFIDLEGIVACYETFNEISSIKNIKNKDIAIKKYIEENTWNQIPQKIQSIVSNNKI